MTNNACSYHVIAMWNGNKVCDGYMSSVMAYALAREIGESFTGHTGQRAAYKLSGLLDRLLKLDAGRCEFLLFCDDTAMGSIRIRRNTV